MNLISGTKGEDRNKKAKSESLQTAIGHQLQVHDRETGVKLGATIQLWYEAIVANHIDPLNAQVRFLEQRVRWLERPMVARWAIMYVRCWGHFGMVSAFRAVIADAHRRWGEFWEVDGIFEQPDEVDDFPTDPDGGIPAPATEETEAVA